ncbi:hypothetical protein ACQRIT_005599 [Beauveria bassiana]
MLYSSSTSPTFGRHGSSVHCLTPQRHSPRMLPLMKPSTASSGTTTSLARASSSGRISNRRMRCATRPSTTMASAHTISFGGRAFSSGVRVSSSGFSGSSGVQTDFGQLRSSWRRRRCCSVSAVSASVGWYSREAAKQTAATSRPMSSARARRLRNQPRRTKVWRKPRRCGNCTAVEGCSWEGMVLGREAAS